MGRRLGPKEAAIRLDASARQSKAIDLYLQGWTFRKIAAELGYAGPSGVKKAIDGAIAKVPSRSVEALRVEIHERSRTLLEQLMPLVMNTKAKRADRLEAIDRVIKIDKELRALHGLDAPTSIHFDVSGLSEDDLRTISGIAPGEPLAIAGGDAAEEGDRGAGAPVGGKDAPPLEGEAGAGEGTPPSAALGEDGSPLA